MTKQIQSALARASFTELLAIAEKAEAHVSFWGARYVTVSGYSGFLHIDDLAERTKGVVRENIEFSETERQIGLKLKKQIDRLYHESDARLVGRNYLTRIIHFIRQIWCDLFDGGYNTRWFWEIRDSDSSGAFKGYTRQQYENVFGSSPLGFRCDMPGRDTGYPDRWSVKLSQK